jgi:hypothetical protein
MTLQINIAVFPFTGEMPSSVDSNKVFRLCERLPRPVRGEVQPPVTCEKSDRAVADILQYLGSILSLHVFYPSRK